MKQKTKKRRPPRRKRKSQGFLGIPNKSGSGAQIAGAIGGLILGSLAGMGIDKFFPSGPSDSWIKKSIKPGALGATALGAYALGKASGIGKSIAAGLVTAAVAAGVKNFTGNDWLFGGLGSTGEENLGAENARLIRELESNNFTPSLPALQGGDPGNSYEYNQMQGMDNEPRMGYSEIQPISGTDPAIL